MEFSKITVITGHYGSGKTNIAVNLAVDMAKNGLECSVIDLDIVNPYFRTADFTNLFTQNGIKIYAPVYAGTNLDIPAINFDIAAIIGGCSNGGHVIIDVGGDDAGAIALGRYYDCFTELNPQDLQVIYVINRYRYLTKTPGETLELMYEIEAASRLKCTAVANNSSLGTQTTVQDIKDTESYAAEVCKAAELELLFTAVREDLDMKDICKPYPVEIYVKNKF